MVLLWELLSGLLCGMIECTGVDEEPCVKIVVSIHVWVGGRHEGPIFVELGPLFLEQVLATFWEEGL